MLIRRQLLGMEPGQEAELCMGGLLPTEQKEMRRKGALDWQSQRGAGRGGVGARRQGAIASEACY